MMHIILVSIVRNGIPRILEHHGFVRLSNRRNQQLVSAEAFFLYPIDSRMDESSRLGT